MLLIGSHVSFKKESQLLGALNESLSYGSTCFMFYTGTPQSTNRIPINSKLTAQALNEMQKNNIDIRNIIIHAPYIVNLANNKEQEKFDFSVNFLKQECQRCEELFINKLVLHPGSHVGLGIELGINNIIKGLNEVLKTCNTIILLETMAGKGTEIGSNFTEIKKIIDGVDYKDKIGICLDTCHLSDAGYDITNFDNILDELESLSLLDKVLCVHVNDSKNVRGSHKDRHDNLGFGYLGFNNLVNIINNERLEKIPKILETPWIDIYPPYKFELQEIKYKQFNSNLKEDVIEYYKNKVKN